MESSKYTTTDVCNAQTYMYICIYEYVKAQENRGEGTVDRGEKRGSNRD